MTARTIQQLFDLKGKTALVTGGSLGLGLQLAHALGEAGARIMLTSRKAGDLEEATAELVATWFAQRGRDLSLAAENTAGAYSYRAANHDQLPDRVRSLLHPYRQLSVGL